MPPQPTTRHLGPTPAVAAADFRKLHYEQSWLVAIGIDDYGTEHPRLYNARRDAEAITAKLRDDFGFQKIISRCDAAATQDEILTLLRDVLPEQVGANDRVVIFFAGHGVTRESADGYKRGYLVPQDAKQGKYSTYIDMDEVRVACNWIPAKHILIVLDCCFSGVAAVTARSAAAASPQIINDAYLQRITSRKARQVLTAGSSDEVVADSGSRPGHSAFTGALLSGLEGSADQNNDGIITACDLAGYVKPFVTRETASGAATGQTPFFSYLAGSGQGDFVFVRPDSEIKVASTAFSRTEVALRSRWKGVAIITLAVATMLVLWLLGRPPPGPDAEVMATMQALETALAEIVATTQAGAVVQQATVVAVEAAPAPIQTAVIATVTAEVRSMQTMVAPTVSVLGTISVRDDISLINPDLMLILSTPTPSCAFEPQDRFGAVWQDHRTLLGCPINAAVETGGAIQDFQHGRMVWRKNINWHYVLHEDGSWQDYENEYEGGMEEPRGYQPPAGLRTPLRGFGMIWRDYQGGLDSRIGWGLENEYWSPFQVQDFENGLLIELENRIYVLGDNGTRWFNP